MPDQTGATTMKELPKYLTIKQSDGSVWGVPVEMIARNRAEFYASEFDGDVEQSLQEDTLPLAVQPALPRESEWFTERTKNHTLVASEKALRNVFGDNVIDEARDEQAFSA
jgi:hypothetical protein